jgi:hypothetical protein
MGRRSIRTETNMQQPRKPSLFKKLFGVKRREQVQPKKTIQPLDTRQLDQVAGGTGETNLPRNGW